MKRRRLLALRCVADNFRSDTNAPISVAQHACNVHDLAPVEDRAEALHHDDVESLIGDVVTNLKAYLPTYRDVEVRLEKLVARRFKLRYPWPASVKQADLVALADEMVCLSNRNDWRDLPFPPSGQRIKVWSPAKAREEFMKRHNALKRA